jgi:hypothetical protein
VTFAVSGAFDRITLQEPTHRGNSLLCDTVEFKLTLCVEIVEPFTAQPPVQPEPSFKPKNDVLATRPISAPVSDSQSSSTAFTTAPSAPTLSSSSSSKRKASPYVPVSDGNRPLNLDVSKFILSSTDRNPLPLSPAESGFAQATTDSDVIDSLLFRHTSLCQIFQNRLSSIRCVREVWDESNIKLAVETLCRSRDSSLWVDILRILNLRPRLLSLDVAVLLLPLLKDLLFEVFEEYRLLLLNACKSMTNVHGC